MISALLTSVTELETRLPQLTGGALCHLGEAAAREDHEAASTKRDPADRRRALAARVALRLTAAQHQDSNLSDAAQLDIRRECQQCGDPHGRPQLTGVSLSSSSSAGHVFTAAATPQQQLGVDLEAIPERLFSEFDEYALHPTERLALDPMNASQAHKTRVQRWVLKESVLKAAGIGLTLPPEQLLLGDAETTTLWHSGNSARVLAWQPVREAPDLRVKGLWCCLVPAPSGYAAAMAASIVEDVRDLRSPWGLSSNHSTPLTAQ